MPSATLERELGLSEAEVERLFTEIVAGLDRQAGAGLVTATTKELVDQAGIEPGPAWRRPKTKTKRCGEPALPSKLRALLPEQLHRSRTRHVSVARYLELTLEVLERYGWARTGNNWRTAGGKRCILGAQELLLALGFGDRDTLNKAGGYLNHQLRQRGVTATYDAWNEMPGRSYGDVKRLLQAAIRDAQKAEA